MVSHSVTISNQSSYHLAYNNAKPTSFNIYYYFMKFIHVVVYFHHEVQSVSIRKCYANLRNTLCLFTMIR